MTPLLPSARALVPFVSVDHMMQLIHHIGLEPMLQGLATEIETDFRRWELFDKTPRVASHSAEGVIELMPTSDGEVYGFKYVNGHPSNTKDGLQTVTAFGLLADVATGYPVLLSERLPADAGSIISRNAIPDTEVWYRQSRCLMWSRNIHAPKTACPSSACGVREIPSAPVAMSAL